METAREFDTMKLASSCTQYNRQYLISDDLEMDLNTYIHTHPHTNLRSGHYVIAHQFE